MIDLDKACSPNVEQLVSLAEASKTKTTAGYEHHALPQLSASSLLTSCSNWSALLAIKMEFSARARSSPPLTPDEEVHLSSEQLKLFTASSPN